MEHVLWDGTGIRCVERHQQLDWNIPLIQLVGRIKNRICRLVNARREQR
jgi:hypothetical protein